jgi:hypothetical protein
LFIVLGVSQISKLAMHLWSIAEHRYTHPSDRLIAHQWVFLL